MAAPATIPDEAGGRSAGPSVTYVLDTCVLLADPGALHRFDEHEVVLPLVVVEELDGQKARLDEVGRNARAAVREIEQLRVGSATGLREAVDLPTGGSLRVEGNHVDATLPAYLDPAKPDHRILSVALELGGVLVTKDGALRIKASQLGVATEDYRADTVHVDEHYIGTVDLAVDSGTLDQLHREGKVALDPGLVPGEGLWRNQYLILRAGPSASGLARVIESDEGGITIERVPGSPRAFGVTPRDVRQTFALDLLTDPDVPCASVMGIAGTGKTFLALAAGLEQVVEQGAYRRLSIYRPLVAVGRQEVGYLPGALEEKLEPWMAAVHDNLYALFRRDEPGEGAWDGPTGGIDGAVDALLARGQLEMAAITYLRGRSITDEFVIIDEAQNLELSTLKVILTRMGAGSKVVFCGDLSQVDNPYISPHGGMSALIETLKGSDLFGHVSLQKGVRSPLAELAATTF
ncbi:PhoH family protein [Egibacter rhizosphaerae]|uniref:PhoH family protein n=1 Tax=Egibacter rhizosphaerae TaxID=1670831 RepID=A0A411YIT6_9ACTN|nr:PhoH family protein [Egibacter rhizosphaerae]QBI21150.1 PhoH family protein [Egibacter rhizosphaerae]